MQEQSIFIEALEKTDPEERAAFLDRVCGGDNAFRRRVERLLQHHQKADRFLERPAADLNVTIDQSPMRERPGTTIGPYKLLQQIGEGGMGVVWMAEQEKPVRRKVALKIIKPGMDSQQVIARFEAERQALALMDHHNIARVLDAGATASGRPFFVMELIHGVAITQYCDDYQLTPRERLELFVPVCHAIQHAHQKGIIHRDIKPSNVMVTLYDGKPVPKVIDFGVAKAIEQHLTERTLFTQYGTIIGTFEYMSPEQAEMSALGIDTRSDIYSLGVLLYELLTGTPPLERQRLRDASYPEIVRLIREEEPPRPSTRLGSYKTLPMVAAARKMEAARLTRLFRGELDWIVMKALEKDRNRRYENASSLAADVQRYLRDESVLACPPSRWYRFRKLAQRNKAAVLTVTTLILCMLLAVVGLIASNVLIRQEQELTKEEKERAEIAQALAEIRAEQIRDGLERLKTANILLDQGRYHIAEFCWDDAHNALTKAVRTRPDHASAWAELADLHSRLGVWELAADDFAHELELRPSHRPARWYFYALLRLHLGDTDGYRQVCVRMRQRFHGTSNAVFLIELVRASVLRPDDDGETEQWVTLAQHAAACRHKGDWFSLYALGLAHYRAGQYEQAVQCLSESLDADQREWSVRTLSYPVLAMAHYRLGQAIEAREALQASARVLDHWTEEMYQGQATRHWIYHLGATASWPVGWWDWLEGHIYYREAKLLIDRSSPLDDPRIHVLRGRAFAGLRWHDKAETEYAAALQLLPNDPQIRMEAHRNRGYACLHLGQWKRSAAEFAQASELQPQEVILGLFRAVSQLKAGEIDAYRRTCATLVQRFEKTDDPGIARHVLLTCVLRPDALPDMARLLPLARVASPPPNDFGPPEASAALYRAGKYGEAVRCLERAAKVYPLRAEDWCFLAMARHQLGRTDEARQALAEAIRWIDAANRDKGDDRIDSRSVWSNWYEKPECEFLLDEVKKLLAN